MKTMPKELNIDFKTYKKPKADVKDVVRISVQKEK